MAKKIEDEVKRTGESQGDVSASSDKGGVSVGFVADAVKNGRSWEDEIPKSVKEETSLPEWDSNANFGIRRSLENDFGVDGKRIGFEGRTVTLDGKPLIEAKNNVDGTTYTDSYDSVAKSLGEYSQKNNVVAARDYLTSSGVPMDITWNEADGTVNVNGYIIKPTYVSDGKAYVPKSVLDNIVSVIKKETGVRTQGEILDDVNRRYGDSEEAAYNAYMGRGGFSWNPASDEAYLAHMETAKRAIEDEYKNNMAAARFRTGGVASSGAMRQAAAMRDAAVNDLDSQRAYFEDRAYGRYLDDGDRLYRDYALASGRRQGFLGEELAVSDADRGNFYYDKSFDSTQRLGEITHDAAAWDYFNGRRGDDLQWQLDVRYLPEMYSYEASNARIENANNALNYSINQAYALPTADMQARLALAEFVKQLREYGYSEGEIAAIIDEYSFR